MALISSKHNEKLKLIKQANKINCFVVTDLFSIKKAEKLGLLHCVFAISPIEVNAPTYLVAKDTLKTDVVGLVRYQSEKEIESNRVIYLDEISDPLNLAKIILLMKRYGYTDLIISSKSVSVYNAKCLAVIKDLIFDINIIHADEGLLKSLKNKGYCILSTGLKSSTLLGQVKTPNKYVLVLGNEARGVKSSILKMSDVVIKIPIQNIDSLNVAVASSIILDNL